MPIQSYDALVTSGDVTVSLETSDPIDGLGSMRINKNAVGFNRHGFARRNVNGERNMRSGALQHVFEIDAGAVAGFNQCYWGVIFLLQEDENIADPSATASFYLAGYYTNGNTGAGEWGVWRFANDLSDAPTQIGGPGPSTPAVALNEVFAMDVEWRQDALEILGVQIIVQIEENPNLSDPYGNLTEVANVTDLESSGGLMDESFGEGPGYSNRSAGSGQITIFVDKARIYDVDAT